MDKMAYGESFGNTRELVKFLNDHELSKEDIVSVLMSASGQIFLIYYM